MAALAKRRLIVCCDGTWNDPDDEDDGVSSPTNVFRLHSMLDHDDPDAQLAHYQPGVGTEGFVDKLLGGMVGAGLDEDIRDGYQWLATKYRAGDAVCLFGFSRGAFTVRCLASIICRFGIVDLGRLEDDETAERVIRRIYRKGYRGGEPLSDIRFHRSSRKVAFLGVWDTVGAFGIPDDKAFLNLFDDASRYRFHDASLHRSVQCARHAVAIDEKRGSFSPTLWKEDGHPDCKQVWFPGVHGDVGGGYKERGLSDGALEWMQEESRARAGVTYRRSDRNPVAPDALDELHDSRTGMWKLLQSSPRAIPALTEANRERFHDSVRERRENLPVDQPPYLPVPEFGAGVEFDVHARPLWAWTGVYLEAGRTYRFKARGEWVDRSIACGPGGTDDGRFQLGEIAHLAGNLVGAAERLFRRLPGRERANFAFSKRFEHADWFELVGAIADGGKPGLDGTHDRHELFAIGDGCDKRVTRGGYLYCFANDAWGFYGNNRGFVTVAVKDVTPAKGTG